MTAVTIDSATDPITTANQTAAVASGTTNDNTNVVTVTIQDHLGATVGPVTATVAALAWSIAATNITALADGALIYQATATPTSGSAVFAATSATKTTGLPLYLTTAIFREAITDTSNLSANKVARAIQTASRRVDEICGRTFGLATVATARVFDADTWQRCRVDDISSTSGLAVKTDVDDDGVYETTWTINTDFTLGPESGLNGGLPWPYTTIRAVGTTLIFPRNCRHKPVEVTAKWGWPAVPDAIIAAATLLAIRFYSRPDAPYGYQGFGDMGALPVRRDWDVEDLLDDYVKNDTRFLVA